MHNYGVPGQTYQVPAPGAGVQASLISQPTHVQNYESGKWSSQFYAAAATPSTADLFSNKQGEVGGGFAQALSIAETNMRESGRMQGNEALTVQAISAYTFYWQNAPIAYQDAANFLNHMVLSWKFSTTILEISPLHLIGAGGGVTGNTADTGAVLGAAGSRAAFTNGFGHIWIYKTLAVPLNANTTFALRCDPGAGIQAVDGDAAGGGPFDQVLKITLLGPYQSGLAS